MGLPQIDITRIAILGAVAYTDKPCNQMTTEELMNVVRARELIKALEISED